MKSQKFLVNSVLGHFQGGNNEFNLVVWTNTEKFSRNIRNIFRIFVSIRSNRYFTEKYSKNISNMSHIFRIFFSVFVQTAVLNS